MTHPLSKILGCAALVALAALPGASLAPAPALAQCIPPLGLTGYWRGNDQGDYYIRQIGTDVWWVGLDATTAGKGWTHAFRGTRVGNTIRGSWADVRGNVGSGSMILAVSGRTMVRTFSSNPNFGGSKWSKRCS